MYAVTNPQVLSVDVGYGNTKYVTSYPENGEITCDLFPSIAVRPRKNVISAGLSDQSHTVIVEVNGQLYEVGKGTEDLGAARQAKQCTNEYINTDQYMAFLKGALYFAKASNISLLAVGLPVQNMRSKMGELRDMLIGQHELVPGHTVNIQDVVVYPQPLGGLWYQGVTGGVWDILKKGRNLVIDPGYFTLDWLTTKNLQPNVVRSGSFPGGMFSILEMVAGEIEQEEGLASGDLSLTDLDTGLRGGDFRIWGHHYNLFKFSDLISRTILHSLNDMMSSVGKDIDIDNIVVVGGAAGIFGPVIKHRFPKHRVYTVQDPIYGNVKGFQFMALQDINQRRAANG